ncbi:hypothetical protein WK81_16635 [Burkholderia ubonensis]|uniref:hypothetical protein n=1 Tax=Burkholderia ubonensis TaxID=101571 RepID=UPI00075ABABF|nr:hypothetical protein [Burkholderia ubonensis]KVV41949.1 hypothetical protein WK81_16635 [Burkholderia ubonensis]
MTVRVGGTISSSLSWTCSLRLGGVQQRGNFGMRASMTVSACQDFRQCAALTPARSRGGEC